MGAADTNGCVCVDYCRLVKVMLLL